MPLIARDVVDYIFQIAPNPQWGTENICEFGSLDAPVHAIGVAWWITTDMLRDMIARGISLGISHERTTYPVNPNKWGPQAAFDDLTPNRLMAQLTAQHGVTIQRFHSNLDLAPGWGMPSALIEQLGWKDRPADWSRGIPVVSIDPLRLGELIAHVKARLRLPFVRYDGDVKRVIRRVALPWGGLCQTWFPTCSALALGFDALIGGDIIDGVVRLAREQGWATIDAMHHATEMRALEILTDKLRAQFPQTPVHYFESPMPWAVV
jgi:putative NIF3 family GTP cyclohydrolase 1 type 2